MPDRKLDIVSHLLQDWPNADKPTEEHAMQTWWVNLRNTGGLRLTTYGYKIFRSIEIESWCWPWPSEKGYIDKQLLLTMDRKLEYPYFINAKTREIVFFSSREAMMATLYGDIKKWLNV
jgi:hypothetical protein